MAELSLSDLIAEVDRRFNATKIHRMFPDAGRDQHGLGQLATWSRSLYPKHTEFMAAGATYKQRLFRAANRVGKTTAAGVELVYHLTGEYPAWWQGHRFDGCNTWWVCGNRGETIRQILQPLLLGPIGAFGTGLIPAEALDFESLKDAKKAATSIGSIKVKHKSGAFSLIEFKAYEQGRSAFEGTERSIWFDEEPPLDVYTECLLRTMTGGNILMMTFTPLKGASDVVNSFSNEGSFEDGPVYGMKKDLDSPPKWVTTCTWDDVPHLSPIEQKELLASIPPYQRDARSKGVPSLGSGAIFPISEDSIVVEPFKIPDHYKRCFGMDVGWNKTAVTWGATDPDTGVTYLYREHYVGEQTPTEHARSVLGHHNADQWIPGVIDPASRGRTQDDGNQLLQNYQDLGLDIEPANNAVESMLWEMLEAMQDGRFKVFSTLTNWRTEFRGYIRDEKGKVVKKNDHAIDSSRYLWASGRERAITKPNSGSQHSGLPTIMPRF